MSAKMTSMISCLLLAHLFVATAPAMATMIPGVTSPPPAAVGHDRDQSLPLLPGGEAEAACWEAVLQAESCAGDVLRSLASPGGADAHVSAACCGVLQAAGDLCIDAVFAKSPFSPLHAPHVKHACGFPISLTAGRRQ